MLEAASPIIFRLIGEVRVFFYSNPLFDFDRSGLESVTIAASIGHVVRLNYLVVLGEDSPRYWEHKLTELGDDTQWEPAEVVALIGADVFRFAGTTRFEGIWVMTIVADILARIFATPDAHPLMHALNKVRLNPKRPLVGTSTG